MDLFDLIRVVLRGWKVVVPIGLLTVGLVAYVQSETPAEYSAEGFVLIQTPELDRTGDPLSARIDPVALSQGIVPDGEAAYTVSPLSGQNFSVTAASPSGDGAESAVEQVINGLEARLLAIQEDLEVIEEERVEIRMAAPEITLTPQDDGSFLADAELFLYSPSTSSPNPYRPDASTGRLLQVAATGDAGRQRFQKLAGDDIGFEVVQDTRDAAALIGIVTTGTEPDEVIEAFYDVQTVMAEELQARQDRADVAPADRLTLEVVDPPLDATDVSPPVSRAAIAILALGAMVALGLTIGLESYRNRKARERGDADPDAATGATVDEPSDADALLVEQDVEAEDTATAQGTDDTTATIVEADDTAAVVEAQETGADRVGDDAAASEPAATDAAGEAPDAAPDADAADADAAGLEERGDVVGAAGRGGGSGSQ